MAFPVAYDITRLGSRLFYPSPNGIHRVDTVLAQHFLGGRFTSVSGVVFLRGVSHRVVTRRASLDVLQSVDAHLGEIEDATLEQLYLSIRNWLLGSPDAEVGKCFHIRRPVGVGKVMVWSLRNAAGLVASASRNIPRQARYINATQYGLAVPGAFDWLASRPDIKPVFFIHDMLPFEMPEYFATKELARHFHRMRNLARYGAGVVVATEVVKAGLRAYLKTLGRGDLPIQIAPIPVSPAFRQSPPPDEALSARPFFIQCGTIEPRKNHLLTLQVWRELVARYGPAAPKLLLVGSRGWENENVIDLLDRSPALSEHVLEVSGLPTPILSRLLASARGLLMPSFGEGFGLPVAEANAVGAPVIASDIPVFHEIADGAFSPISPIDGLGWLREIECLSSSPRQRRAARQSDNTETFLATIEGFVDSL